MGQNVTKACSSVAEIHMHIKMTQHSLRVFIPGGWWQQNTINNHLNRQWDNYAQSLPKPAVTWDRNAKRPTPPPKPKEHKRKPKPKPQQSIPSISSSAKEVLTEEFEFSTPPLSPFQKEPPPLIRKTSDDNDDFWEFYNQELPLP